MSRTTLNGSHINAPTSPEPKTQRLIIHRVVQQYDRPPTSPGSDLRLPQSYRSYLARCALLCGKIFQCNCRPMHFVNFLCYKAFMREILWRLPAANCRRSFVPLFNPHADENAFWKKRLNGQPRADWRDLLPRGLPCGRQQRVRFKKMRLDEFGNRLFSFAKNDHIIFGVCW